MYVFFSDIFYPDHSFIVYTSSSPLSPSPHLLSQPDSLLLCFPPEKRDFPGISIKHGIISYNNTSHKPSYIDEATQWEEKSPNSTQNS